MQENLIFTTNPDVALRVWQMPYEFTGVIDRSWIEACKIVGRNYTSREMDMGWPCAMEPHRLACMQAPDDPTGQTYIYTAMEGGCRLGRVPCEPFERHDYEILKNGERKLAEVWIDYAITPQTFFSWLKNQNEQPSRFIEAWFKANGLHWQTPKATPPSPAPSTATTAAMQEPAPFVPTPETANPFPLADWCALVAYRKASQGKDWGLGDQLEILRGELVHRTKGNNATETDALTVMAKEIGIGREGLRKALKTSASERKRSKKMAPADSTLVRYGSGVNRRAA